MAETVTTDFSNKKVKDTYKGILHFDRSLQNNKKDVYDGAGNKTSLTLGVDGLGADINGDVLIQQNLTVSNTSIVSNLSVGGDVRLLSGGNVNDLIIGEKNTSVSLRSLSTTEVGKLRIRETTTDYELIFGNPNLLEPNLFSIIVKKDGSNNLYIKNNYNSIDTSSPLWINRSTGEVNIKNLNVGSISNSIDVGGTGTSNANRNTIPPGAIMMFSSITIPQGWLECDGSIVNRSLYPDLYTIIQQAYKTLNYDIDLQFQLPDLRGLFVRGWDHGKGIDVGRDLGTYQEDAFKAHSHNYQSWVYESDSTSGGDMHAADPLYNTPTSVVGGTETRPKNISLIYCIKW